MIGVFPGKFLPPHRGHLASILQAHSMCAKLYVVACERKAEDEALCSSAEIQYISGITRRKWLNQETHDINGISVLLLDEERYGIPSWPNGWGKWSEILPRVVPEPFDILFGGEPEYAEGTRLYFPGVTYALIDPNRERCPISATEIRRNPIKHWDFIITSARPFFCKKVLIAGTESCGKTTLTNKLAKIYNTSCSEEVGRYYSRDYLGGDEGAFSDEDFLRIAHLQYENDKLAVNNANRVCFIDTDAIVTNYYARMYLGHECDQVETYVDLSKYDAILLLKPDVDWFPDGLRFAGEQEQRWKLHEHLRQMYVNHGAGANKLYEIGGSYLSRFRAALSIVDNLLFVQEGTEDLGT